MFKGKVDARRPPGLQARILSKKKINATRTIEQEKRYLQLIIVFSNYFDFKF
jgi:hypothetical protein